MTANATVSAVVIHELAVRGLTRTQLADLLGVDKAWVTRKLNGHRHWLIEDLDLVSHRLGLPLAALLMAPVATVEYLLRRVVTAQYRRLADWLRWRVPVRAG